MVILYLCYVLYIAIEGKASIYCERGSFLAINGSCVECPENCKSCISSNLCLVCQTGYKGDACQEECSNCLPGTRCEQISGYCLESCKDGFTGDSCDKLCDSKCKSCDRLIRKKCLSCLDNRYGIDCEEVCSKRCLYNTCNDIHVAGECTYGCSTGYWGYLCEHNCSIHCNERECDNKTGDCLKGCLDGYTGTNCTSRLERSTDENNDLRRVEIYVGSVFGSSTILFEAIVICVLCIYMRRFRSQVKRSTNPSANHSSQSRAANDLPLMKFGSETYYNTAEFADKTVDADKLSAYVQQKTTSDYIVEFEQLPNGLIRPFTESQKDENLSKNKNIGIYPYDESRVVLKNGTTDYINASFIDGYKKARAYIASSDPSVTNMDDMYLFWKMVWQQKCGIIVMMSTLEECKEHIHSRYWPELYATALFEDIRVTCLKDNNLPYCTIRTLNIRKGKKQRVITQLHFTDWSDTGRTEGFINLGKFRQEVNKSRSELDGPTLIHCSDGVGRTGIYIALDILIQKAQAEGIVDIFSSVRKLREQRVKMVQNVEQYICLHRALVHALTWYTRLGDISQRQQVDKNLYEECCSDDNSYIIPV